MACTSVIGVRSLVLFTSGYARVIAVVLGAEFAAEHKRVLGETSPDSFPRT